VLGSSRIMSRTSALLCAVALLLLGIGGFFASRPSSDMAGRSRTPGASPLQDRAGPHDAETSASGRAGHPSHARHPASTWPELSAKYGESRTNLSRHVVEAGMAVLDNVLARGDKESAAALASAMTNLTNKLKLTPAQQEDIGHLLSDHEARRRDDIKAFVADMREDPRQLVELMLVGDAKARDKINQDDYERTARATAGELERSTGIPLMTVSGNAARNPERIADPAFQTAFNSLLDPEQAAIWQRQVDQASSSAASGAAVPGWLPPLELEKLERDLDNARNHTAEMRKKADAAK